VKVQLMTDAGGALDAAKLPAQDVPVCDMCLYQVTLILQTAEGRACVRRLSQSDNLIYLQLAIKPGSFFDYEIDKHWLAGCSPHILFRN
jgi:hypothetical protein